MTVAFTHSVLAMTLGGLSLLINLASLALAVADWRLAFLGPISGLSLSLFAHRLNCRDALDHGFPDDALAPGQSRLPLIGIGMSVQLGIFIYGMALTFGSWWWW
jgi:hypothetical protein